MNLDARRRISREIQEDRSRARSRLGQWTAMIIAGAFVLFALGILGNSYLEKRPVTARIEDKDRICESSSTSEGTGRQDCYYLIWTDQGTFKITDTLLRDGDRFSSTDVYGRYRVGRTYRFKVYGWRVGCSSAYPTVATARPEEVPS